MTFSLELAVSQERLWAFHNRVSVLTQITPPRTRVRLLDPPEALGLGVAFTLVVSQPPVYLPLRWRCEFVAFEPPYRFVDRQVPGQGPFVFWEHEHRFESLGPQSSRLIDTVRYTPPLGPLGTLADRVFLHRELERLFAHRHRVTKALLEGV